MEILLVEDNLQDAGTTIEALKQGYIKCRVSLLTDGEEALRFLLRQGVCTKAPRPDLKLPKMDGRELLAHVKALRRFWLDEILLPSME